MLVQIKTAIVQGSVLYQRGEYIQTIKRGVYSNSL